jgi:WD40-like Beta Propeller Repeat
MFVPLLGCGRIAFDPTGDAAGPATVDGSPSACTAPFEAPQLATWFNTPMLDWAPDESSDGLTMYFGSSVGGDTELYRSVRATTSATWSAPVQLSELAGVGDEQDNPALSADELELYFGTTKVFRATRNSRTETFGPATITITDGVFTRPEGPFLTADGLTLYFTAIEGGQYDIYYVTRPVPAALFEQANAVPFTEINTSVDDGWPYLTDDELRIYFTSRSAGSLDLWTATRSSRTETFGDATLVDVVNSADSEYDPELSSDGNTLWFASDRTGGQGSYDIYFSHRDCP